MSLDAFGPNLRRLRLQRGITLKQIAERTKLAASLYADLESNNFSRWPGGIYARAYIRQYASAVGADPEATVDEFCRWFAEGDRRAERVVREHSEIIGHQIVWKDQIPPSAGESDRRRQFAPVRATQSMASMMVRLRRAFGKA